MAEDKVHFTVRNEKQNRLDQVCSASWGWKNTYRRDEITCKNCLNKYDNFYSGYNKTDEYKRRLKEDIEARTADVDELRKLLQEKATLRNLRIEELRNSWK